MLAPATFESLDPATGDVVGVHPVHGTPEVEAAVAAARRAADWWGALTFAQRARVLDDWRAALVRRSSELVEVVRAETGKPRADAMLEVGIAIDHLAWATHHADGVLGRRRTSPGLLMANFGATVEYRALGVVGVIGPWNYPVFTPMGSIAYALAAGNAVVFKPSELTPGVGRWLADSLTAVLPDPPLLQTVTGLGETGAALASSAGIDKLAFTGSTATGKKVMAAAAENLTPVLIEAGGKDALLVDEDADLAAAADAAVWGGMSNAGQTCIGIERVYVHERVHDAFVREVERAVGDVRGAPESDGGAIGPITMPSQLDVIRGHVDDALARGGRAVVGGADAVGDRYVQPTVLVDVPEDSTAVTEETFGPTLTIAAVPDMDEAVARANGTAFGLGGAVFSRARGTELAARLRSGMVTVNAVMAFVGIPSLPFGGVGDSGFGRIHGADGLREFTYAHAVAQRRTRGPVEVMTFDRSAWTDRTFATVVATLHGRAGQAPRRAAAAVAGAVRRAARASAR